MKKLLLLTTSPTVGGNGDALMQAAAEAAKECGTEIRHIDIRDLTIHPCKGCYGCASRDTCKNTTAYLDRARAIARWVCE